MTDRKQEEVEVYVDEQDFDRIVRWVESVLGPAARADDGSDGAVRIYHVKVREHVVPVILERGPSSFTGVWFNSPHTPWATDVECGRRAASDLGVEVRCDPGYETPPSVFLRIVGQTEELVDWKDESSK